VVDRVGGDSNEVYVVNNERGRDEDLGASDVFKLDTNNGRMKLLTFNNPGKVGQWLADHTGAIRVAVSAAADPKTKRIKETVFYREDEKSEWKTIHEGYWDEGTSMSPQGFDFDNKTLFVAGRFNGRDKAAIHIWDFAKNAAGTWSPTTRWSIWMAVCGLTGRTVN
jgi:hypothetical protein